MDSVFSKLDNCAHVRYNFIAPAAAQSIAFDEGKIMPTFFDLSHTIRSDMPHSPGVEAPTIGAVWTHEEAADQGYQDTTCELTQVRFVTSIGTYLDAPFHFDPQGADISQLDLSQLVLPGVVLDLRRWAERDAPLPINELDGLDIANKALLLWTGWSEHWGDDVYYHPPFVSRPLAQRLRDLRPALVGIDTLLIDSPRDPTRPVHTLLLRAGVLIVENLTGLSAPHLHGQTFTFVAVPVKVAGAAAFPVRAFAIVN